MGLVDGIKALIGWEEENIYTDITKLVRLGRKKGIEIREIALSEELIGELMSVPMFLPDEKQMKGKIGQFYGLRIVKKK